MALVLGILIAVTLLFAWVNYQAVVDRSGVGGRAADIIGGPYWHIDFELDYETPVDEKEVDNFLGFVKRYTGKSAAARVTDIGLTGLGSSYSADDLSKILEGRDSYSLPLGVIAVRIVVLGGTFENPDGTVSNVAGLTVSATDIFIFRGAFLPQNLDIVMAHEFGHALGLCGIVVPNEQVCDGKGHARNPDSLMAETMNTLSPWVRDLMLMPEEVSLFGVAR